MRDDFPGWVLPDQETLDWYWQEAIFAVDTSVLLDLYRFSAEAREGLLDALRSFGDRLWIPHQVALEFHKNRFGVLLAQRDAEEKLLKELDGIERDLDGQLSKLLRGAGRRDLDPTRDAITDGFKELREKLQKAEQAHTEGLGKSIRDDPIYEEVEKLCADRIGAPFTDSRLAEVIKDAEERFRNQQPPGYLDDGKSDDAKFGDVIVWHQLFDMANTKKRPVVLVADDRKADWVWEERGKTLGPRPELVAEMREVAGVGFHLYTPSRLFELWKDRQEGGSERSEILEEIRSPSPAESPEHLLRDGPSRERAGGPMLADPSERWWQSHSSRLVATARSEIHVEGGEWKLSLQFTPNEINGLTPGIRARVSDDRGNSSSVDYPIGLGVAGRPRTIALSYPYDFLGTRGLPEGQYTVEWTAFSHQRNFEGVAGEIKEDLTHDVFFIVGGLDGTQGAAVEAS